MTLPHIGLRGTLKNYALSKTNLQSALNLGPIQRTLQTIFKLRCVYINIFYLTQKMYKSQIMGFTLNWFHFIQIKCLYFFVSNVQHHWDKGGDKEQYNLQWSNMYNYSLREERIRIIFSPQTSYQFHKLIYLQISKRKSLFQSKYLNMNR